MKIGIPAGEDVEYFWIRDLEVTDTDIGGTVSNRPRLAKTIQFRQRLRFPREAIVDWSYVDFKTRRRMGNFTLCALLTKETQQEAEKAKRRLGMTCE